MDDFFEPSGQQALRSFAWGHVLLAFDFDGTLAPIVATPGAARMRPRTSDLLRQLARVYPCVVISGRSQGDIESRLTGVKDLQVIGNHGMGPLRRMDEFALQTRAALAQLKPVLSRVRGAMIEDKQYSLAIHYRQAADPHDAEARIEHALSMLDGYRVIHGHAVVNVLPEGSPHKGGAVLDARERLGCERAIYIGDDDADEDVFALHLPDSLLTVRVGQSDKSAASFFVPTQEDVDLFLQRLLELRPLQSLEQGRA